MIAKSTKICIKESETVQVGLISDKAEVVAYSVTVVRDQMVVGVIPEAAVRCRGYVTRRIVVEGLGRYHRVIAELLDSSRSDSAEIIISITHFGRICKYLI